MEASSLTSPAPMPELFTLHGQTALVTGCSRGIGAAIAVGLSQAGARVCLAQRDVNNKATYDKIVSQGGKAEIIHCDLSNSEDVKGVFDRAVKAMGGDIDILVNAGGYLQRSPVAEITETAWDNLFDVNVKALFLLCQSAGKHMVPRRRGKIINVASLNSFIGGENVASYSASKGAVSQLTKALSNEWAKFNIQVNALAPGSIATDINTDLRSNKAQYQNRLDRTPAGRWGYPLDLAGPAVFLASGASQFVTGEVLVVDGGALCR